MEILLGINHDIYLDEHNWNKSARDKEKRAKAAKAKGQEEENRRQAESVTLEIKSGTPFSICNMALPKNAESENPLPRLISKGTLTIKDSRGRPIKGIPVISLSNDKLIQKIIILKMADRDHLKAHFKYTCNGIRFDYVRSLTVSRQRGLLNHSANLRKLWVPGVVAQTFNGWNMHFHLPNGRIYHGSTNGQKPVVVNQNGAPCPDYILRWGTRSANFPLHLPLLKGNKGKFLVRARP